MFLVIFYLRRSEISIFQYQPHSPRSKQTSYLCLGNIETCTVSDFVVFSFYMTKQISKESISRMKRVAWDGKREVPITISLVYWILIILLCLESEPGRGVRHEEPVAQHCAAWHQHQRWAGCGDTLYAGIAGFMWVMCLGQPDGGQRQPLTITQQDNLHQASQDNKVSTSVWLKFHQVGSYVFFALEPNTRYEVRLQARNSHGWSLFSKDFIFRFGKYIYKIYTFYIHWTNKNIYFVAQEQEAIVQKSFRLRCQVKIMQVSHFSWNPLNFV